MTYILNTYPYGEDCNGGSREDMEYFSNTTKYEGFCYISLLFHMMVVWNFQLLCKTTKPTLKYQAVSVTEIPEMFWHDLVTFYSEKQQTLSLNF